MLDLAGTGISLTPLAGSSAYFDYTGAGFATRTGWITSGEGVLVQDDGSGTVTANDLLGAVSGNGFADLARLDGNGDGAITAADAGFAGLRVWVDANGDGTAQAGELETLGQAGISSISVSPTNSGQQLNGNTLVSTATFTVNGATHQVAEVDFATSPMETRYTPPSGFAHTPDALLLPELVGWGKMPALRVAMSQDAGLLSAVQSLVATASTLTGAQFDAAFETLVQDWAGASSVAPGSWGGSVDARHLAVVYAFYGIDPVSQPIYAIPPNWHSGPQWENVYHAIVDELEVRFASQVALSQILNGVPGSTDPANPFLLMAQVAFDPAADRVSVDVGQLVSSIVAAAPADPIAAQSWYDLTGRLMRGLRVDPTGVDTARLSEAVLSKMTALGVPQALQETTLAAFGYAAVVDETAASGIVTPLPRDAALVLGAGDMALAGGRDELYVVGPDGGTVSISDASAGFDTRSSLILTGRCGERTASGFTGNSFRCGGGPRGREARCA